MRMTRTTFFPSVGLIVSLMIAGLIIAFAQMSVTVWAHGDDDHDHDLLTETINNALQQDAIGQAGDLQAEMNANRAEQERLKAQIADAQGREKSLRNQIIDLENRARLKELEIAETQSTITTLQEQLVLLDEDIESLQLKAILLDESMGRLRRAFAARVKSSYEASFSSVLGVFLASGDFQTAILRYSYLKNLQIEDNRFLTDLKLIKEEYEERTQQLEELKVEKEQLRSDFESQQVLLGQQRTQLATERNNRAYLLEVTNNEEAQYQQLLVIAQQQEATIRQAINSILGRAGEGSFVAAGDTIGLQGNTGDVWCYVSGAWRRPGSAGAPANCGSHLHFMILTCGHTSCEVNPTSYLYNAQYVTPLSDWTVTQAYGATTFNPWHTGIDIASFHGAPIRAIADGVVIYGTDNNGGNYAIIKHSDSFYSAYWHLQ